MAIVVYYGKTNNDNELAEKKIKAHKLFFGTLIDDYNKRIDTYVFIGKTYKKEVSQLWKVKNVSGTDSVTVEFDAILDENNFPLFPQDKFLESHLFKIDMATCNRVIKQQQAKILKKPLGLKVEKKEGQEPVGFFELQLVDKTYESFFSKPSELKNFLEDKNNYRSFRYVSNFDSNSKDIQVKVEGTKTNPRLTLFKANFIDGEIFNKFSSKNVIGKELHRNKYKIWRKSYEEEEQLPIVLSPGEYSVPDFYDTFCCLPKAKKTGKKNQSNNISSPTVNNVVEENKNLNGSSTAEEVVKSELVKNNYLGKNVLFYGRPGCGKSYKVKKLLHISKDDSPKLDDKYYKRVLFHPEYSYSDFVGQILPVSEGNSIKYKFTPGPFTQILKDAIENENNNYYLIIEEINRGNAPAIFGDIFQLLDRDEDGKSEYEIDNEDIAKIVFGGEEHKNEKVYIPKNLTILATMNTSDQNVFTIDTAFKRRWKMVNVKDDDNVNIRKKELPDTDVTWGDFINKLNNLISEVNSNMQGLAEDKLLGNYFVSESDLKDKKSFWSKIIMYLWTDVFKYNQHKCFNNDLKTLNGAMERALSDPNKLFENTDLNNLFANSNQGVPTTNEEEVDEN